MNVGPPEFLLWMRNASTGRKCDIMFSPGESLSLHSLMSVCSHQHLNVSTEALWVPSKPSDPLQQKASRPCESRKVVKIFR